jgi:hypothetical protein
VRRVGGADRHPRPFARMRSLDSQLEDGAFDGRGQRLLHALEADFLRIAGGSQDATCRRSRLLYARLDSDQMSMPLSVA